YLRAAAIATLFFRLDSLRIAFSWLLEPRTRLLPLHTLRNRPARRTADARRRRPDPLGGCGGGGPGEPAGALNDEQRERRFGPRTCPGLPRRWKRPAQ